MSLFLYRQTHAMTIIGTSTGRLLWSPRNAYTQDSCLVEGFFTSIVVSKVITIHANRIRKIDIPVCSRCIVMDARSRSARQIQTNHNYEPVIMFTVTECTT
jgi:hypothetical protein